MKRWGLLGVLLSATLLLSGLAQAGVWQYTVEAQSIDGKHKSPAWLWIPPDCNYVRGVIVGAQVILEKKALEDDQVRAAAASEGLAELYFCPAIIGEFHYEAEHRADQILQNTLDAFAEQSGYTELSKAPVLGVGHSGGGITVWNMAYWNPARCFGIVGLHTALLRAPSWDPKASMDGVPAMNLTGQYESWGDKNVSLEQHWWWLRGDMLSYRGFFKKGLVNMIMEPGGSHFSFNPSVARHVALFIKSAAHARIPATPPPANSPDPVKLNDIAVESGWLTDITFSQKSQYPPAPYAEYKGDPRLAMWHLNEELARSAEELCQVDAGKKDQRITFLDKGVPLVCKWIEDLPFEPIADGMTMKVAADFCSATPEGVAGAGVPLGHANGPIHYSLIGGWGGGGEQIGPDTFRIRFTNLGSESSRNGQIMILATQDGDQNYRKAEQAMEIKYPLKNKEGKPQTITFPSVGSTSEWKSKIQLKATSDSGLPVEYCVIAGPAEVEGQTLKLLPMPPRAKFPVKIIVEAYQWGRSIEPQVQTAKPIQQTILLEAKSWKNIF